MTTDQKTESKFITIEGAEGVGKSSVIGILSNKFKDLGLEIVRTHEPGGSAVADRIRGLFVDPPKDEPLESITELLLISAARAQHVSAKIRPALKKGKVVLCDRFADSSRVYQGVLGKIDNDFLETVIARSTGNLEPDLTLILDCPPDIARNRAQNADDKTQRTGAKRYDDASLAIYDKMRQSYLEVARRFPNRIIKIDATGDLNQVAEKCWETITKRFNLRPKAN